MMSRSVADGSEIVHGASQTAYYDKGLHVRHSLFFCSFSTDRYCSTDRYSNILWFLPFWLYLLCVWPVFWCQCRSSSRSRSKRMDPYCKILATDPSTPFRVWNSSFRGETPIFGCKNPSSGKHFWHLEFKCCQISGTRTSLPKTSRTRAEEFLGRHL